MIFGIRNHARDDATLFGNPQALFMAKGFKIDGTGHDGLSCKARRSRPVSSICIGSPRA